MAAARARDGSGRDREIARRALALLAEAGYRPSPSGLIKDGALLRFDILVRSRDEERLALNFSASLAKIGIDAQVRLIEEAQYNRNRQSFDFDMIIGQWLPVAAPGGEQRSRWGSGAAKQEGSVNLCGVSSPAVDALIDALVAAQSREDLITAARALDRVLLSGFYFAPLYHATEYGRRISRGSSTPRAIRAIRCIPTTCSSITGGSRRHSEALIHSALSVASTWRVEKDLDAPISTFPPRPSTFGAFSPQGQFLNRKSLEKLGRGGL